MGEEIKLNIHDGLRCVASRV